MSATVLHGDCRELLATMEPGSAQMCVTSPPYFGLRDYGVSGQIGLESTPDAFVAEMVAVFRAVKRVLRDDGTLWLNLGDSYSRMQPDNVPQSKNLRVQPPSMRERIVDLPPKNLLGIPWRVAFALQADGWYLRSDIIWAKPNPMPESVTDRPTKSHEYLFLLAKQERYYYDAAAIADPLAAPEKQGRSHTVALDYSIGSGRADEKAGDRGLANREPLTNRNRRTVWTVATQPFKGWLKTSHRVRVEADDADDDTTRTESPDCPVHGDSAVRAASVACGEHGDDASIRSPRSDGRPALGLEHDSAPTGQLLDGCSPDGSSDSLLPSSVPTATDRSSRTSKTGRAPATTSPCTVFAQTSESTDGIGALPGSADSADRTSESSTAPDDSRARLSDQTVARIAHSLSSGSLKCSCTYHKTIYKDTSHFATFPPALIEPCIRAGSARQACETCGAAWGRVVERTAMVIDRSERTHDKGHTRASGTMRAPATSTTTGFAPRCDCETNTGSGRSLVLDPFFGAGTTGVVADRLGRDCIGIELNPAYAAMASNRITDDSPLFSVVAQS